MMDAAGKKLWADRLPVQFQHRRERDLRRRAGSRVAVHLLNE